MGKLPAFLFFVFVGGVQYLLDAAAFSMLIIVSEAETANVLSRMPGGFVGYFVNGYIPFRDSCGAKLSVTGLLRLILVWIVMTTISTLAISTLIPLLAGEWVYAVIIKLSVEAILVMLSFTLQKLFVFR